MATAVLLERTLVLTAARLDHVGIDVRVLKGSAAAHLDYADPALRSFGDIDLLVRGDHFDDAIASLVGAGHRRKFPEPRPGFDRRFSKGSCVVAPNGHELDLHRTLAMGPYGVSLRTDDLWQRQATFRLAGRELPALAREERFLHACFHAALGDARPRLSTLRDIAEIQQAGALDEALVLELAAAWRAEAVVARALTLVQGTFELPSRGSLGSWATAYQPSPRDERALSVYLDPAQTYAAKSFAAVRAVPGVTDKARFVFSLAFPRRGYLDERGEGRWARWRRGLRQITRSRRRPTSPK